jgi:hypothetical protein
MEKERKILTENGNEYKGARIAGPLLYLPYFENVY